MARAVDLRLELRGVTPTVWRVLRVPAELRLDDLHHAIQAVMGWEDFHPHVFEVGERDYGPRSERLDEDEDDTVAEESAWAGEDHELTVADALDASPDGFAYIYDFREDWHVRITPLSEAPAGVDSVICLAGEHTGPQVESRDLDPFSIEAANRRLARGMRPRATAEFPAGPHASADQQLLARLTLVALLLGSRPTRRGAREAWKHHRTEILDALQEAGFVETDPQRRSVTLTDAGVAQAERWLARLRRL